MFILKVITVFMGSTYYGTPCITRYALRDKQDKLKASKASVKFLANRVSEAKMTNEI